MALIYAIRSYQTDKYYVGSTTKPLAWRFSHHKSTGETTSQEIIKYGDAYIELIEECDIEVRYERERFHIENGNVVNKKCPIRSEEEYKTIKKAYYEARVDEILTQRKVYYVENTDEIKAKRAVYRSTHIDDINVKMKAYYEAHKDEIKAKNKAYRDAHKDEIKIKRKQRYEIQKLK
jgi:hypothetical protein